jgi:hypothetical protein
MQFILIINRRIASPALGFILFCLSVFGTISAQSTAPEKKWNFLTDIYLLFPNMNGETGIGDLITVPIDANPGDIFKKLEIGGMLYLEAHNNKWAITSDLVFMNLEDEVTPGTLINSGTVTAKQGIWEAAGLYRISPYLEVGIGGRLNRLETGMDVLRNVIPEGTEQVTGSHTATWYDPIIIARFSGDIIDKWIYELRGDLGGFGIGSDFTWQIQVFGGYRFSKLFQLTAGYRLLSTNYDKGTGSQQFIFNIDEFGPVISLGFNF